MTAPEHIVVCQDRNGELYIPERDLIRTSQFMTVADILGGQFSRVRSVYRNGEDVSADIAAEVRRIATMGGDEIPTTCIDFIEEHLGCEPVRVGTLETVWHR